jgi:hypothetical protein
MNYLPHHTALLAMIRNGAAQPNSKTIVIPEELLKKILQLALSAADFDEATYLRENPDVADSVRRGLVPDAKFHYVNYGYFEGRKGAIPVDGVWYERQYPDVATAIRSGKAEVKSPSEHFYVAGAGEGRSPNAASQVAVKAFFKDLQIS